MLHSVVAVLRTVYWPLLHLRRMWRQNLMLGFLTLFIYIEVGGFLYVIITAIWFPENTHHHH